MSMGQVLTHARRRWSAVLLKWLWVCLLGSGFSLGQGFLGARAAAQGVPLPEFEGPRTLPGPQDPAFLPLPGSWPQPSLSPGVQQAAQAPAQPLPKGAGLVGKDQEQPGELPAPRPVSPFGPGQFRLPLLGGPECPIPAGSAPRATPAVQAKYARFVKELIDPEMTLDLFVGRTRLMVLKEAPRRVQISDESVGLYTLLSPTEISLLGKSTGVTVLTLWFPDPKDANKSTALTYYVRVLPDPEQRQRLDRIYKELAKEINHAFPDSVVYLQLVGDKLVVSGYARDVADASHIMRIVRANAPNQGRDKASAREASKTPFALRPDGSGFDGLPTPGVEDYDVAGGSNVVNLMRINGEQQVMLRVTVAEVNRAAARSIGMNFSLLNRKGQGVFANNTGSIASGGESFGSIFGSFSSSGIAGGAQATGVPAIPGVALGAGGFNNLPAALDNGQVRLAISALRDLNYARSLAEPNLVTMNGQTARFSAGGQFPVPVVTGFTAAGLQGVSFVPYGVQLLFTPYITDRDRIRLVVSAQVSSRDLSTGQTNVAGSSVPSLISRSFMTTVELREGQTLAVAGLVQNNLGADAHRIPLIGDIPILNNLTGFSRITAGEQELVVLITPELVHPLEHKEVPPLPGSDLFEPNDLEFYLLGRIESHRPFDYRSPIRTDFRRIMQYYHAEDMYICGPHGHQDELP